ncbi:hypothetical protein PoB_000531400 [Plakobranchus ocellatus]|uniref:Uncharacterized protein n=1 Tax=Plakobranchus ocellatus TaxID=259542 RepID=A0AAV3Y7A8_9GAST|nr:hypothetical protein PoB_000531400 [Plakobranchus ocellatus]
MILDKACASVQAISSLVTFVVMINDDSPLLIRCITHACFCCKLYGFIAHVKTNAKKQAFIASGICVACHLLHVFAKYAWPGEGHLHPMEERGTLKSGGNNVQLIDQCLNTINLFLIGFGIKVVGRA